MKRENLAHWMTSCLASFSSALLASSFVIFAPEAGQAFTLIDSDNDNLIDAIEDLAVDGSLFDVDFIAGAASDVYSDGFDFDTFDDAVVAANAIVALLPLDLEDQEGNAVEVLFLPYVDGPQSPPPGQIASLGFDFAFSFPRLQNFTGIALDVPEVFAVFTEAGGGDRATTPEPSLILGFITLGGLMLGSKTKTKS